MRIVDYIEYAIDPELHEQIKELRNACFVDCQHDRSYFKQLPHFRLLAFCDDKLVGHLGIDHRMMAFGGKASSVFGLVDMCVEFESRGQGIATQLIRRAEEIARSANIEFLLLLASDHRLYEKCGFTSLSEIFMWLRIEEHVNYGVAVEHLRDEVMIKPLVEASVSPGPVDFLGYMF